MSLWQWLGLAPREEQPEDGLVEIERALERMEPGRARFVACFAYILTRAARADHEVTDGERREMERIVAERAHITPAEAAIVVQLATRHSFKTGGHDDYAVTQEFNAIATHEQKLALLDCLFAVSGADAAVLTVEDNEVRRVARELRIEHGDYIAVRAKHVHNVQALRPGEDSER
jgi:uncharacterized tellurite resistance protein B-like protein